MTESPDAYEGLTRMLFIDAIVGVGFPHPQVGVEAVSEGLATFTGDQHNEAWAWSRTALNVLHVEDLQDLYTSLKTYEVTHAH